MTAYEVRMNGHGGYNVYRIVDDPTWYGGSDEYIGYAGSVWASKRLIRRDVKVRARVGKELHQLVHREVVP